MSGGTLIRRVSDPGASSSSLPPSALGRRRPPAHSGDFLTITFFCGFTYYVAMSWLLTHVPHSKSKAVTFPMSLRPTVIEEKACEWLLEQFLWKQHCRCEDRILLSRRPVVREEQRGYRGGRSGGGPGRAYVKRLAEENP